MRIFTLFIGLVFISFYSSGQIISERAIYDPGSVRHIELTTIPAKLAIPEPKLTLTVHRPYPQYIIDGFDHEYYKYPIIPVYTFNDYCSSSEWEAPIYFSKPYLPYIPAYLE